MNKIKAVFTAFCVMLGCAVFFCSTASAATVTLEFNSNNEIIKAYNVEIGGDLYNVEFVEGTGYDAYTYENGTWTFDFDSEEAATAAAEALLEQVFTGDYNDPATLFGIEDSATSAKVYIAYDTASWSSTYLTLVYARNYASDPSDEIATKYLSASKSTADEADAVYAVFTKASAVPVPGTLTLLGTGMLALTGAIRGKHS